MHFCNSCGKEFNKTREWQKFCSEPCKLKFFYNEYKKTNKQKTEKKQTELIQKHKGALGELLACTWLLENGYEVFRNVSAVGEIDLIALKDNKVLKLDVKCLEAVYDDSKINSPGILTEEQRKRGVRPFFVNSRTNKVLGFGGIGKIEELKDFLEEEPPEA